MLLTDADIREHCRDEGLWFNGKPLISPMAEECQEGVISYGLTGAGYDLRLDREVLVFKPSYGLVVDPKAFRDEEYKRQLFDIYQSDGRIVVPGHGYVLVQSYEYLALPWWLKGRCVGKSTYARCGLIVNTTPLEPEWEGRLTIEIANANPCHVAMYAMEGVAQLEFERLARRPERTYADKKGKYQGQLTVTPPRCK